jgi:hypothetical protein
MDIELQKLEELFNAGQLTNICDHVVDFVGRHRNEILKLSQGPGDTHLLDAIKILVRQRGSIHLPSEMADQIREINNEIWYRGERGDFDKAKIKEEWAMKYAGAWRTWRVKEILYVVDRMSDKVLALLRQQTVKAA